MIEVDFAGPAANERSRVQIFYAADAKWFQAINLQGVSVKRQNNAASGTDALQFTIHLLCAD